MQMCLMSIATAAIPWIPHGYDILLHYLQLYAMLVQCGIGVVTYKLLMPLLVTSWALAALRTFYRACEVVATRYPWVTRHV